MEKKNKKISYTGERLVQDKKILHPQRVENLARFNYFKKHLSSGKVLDYGCGTGEGTHFLSTFSEFEVIGIDISLDALRYAETNYKKDRVYFICGNILQPCLKNHCFDGVISVEVIEHIDDAHLYLSNIRRLMKPDGFFMLTTPNQRISSPTDRSLWPDHVREYSSDELKDLLTQYFSRVEILGQYIPIYESNLFRKMVKKVSPLFKPLLPKFLRVRALPFLFTMIKSELTIEDIIFTPENIDAFPTLVALCSDSKTA